MSAATVRRAKVPFAVTLAIAIGTSLMAGYGLAQLRKPDLATEIGTRPVIANVTLEGVCVDVPASAPALMIGDLFDGDSPGCRAAVTFGYSDALVISAGGADVRARGAAP